MGVSAAETAKKHDEILAKSIRLFRKDGLGVSVGDVMKAAGLTHGPFYNHFASKEALIGESLIRAMEGSLEQMNSFPANAAGRDAYLATYLSEAHVADPCAGCSVAALATEIARQPAVSVPFTQKVKETIALFASHFPWSRSKKLQRSKAIHAYSAMVGAIVLARAVTDKTLAMEILEETRRWIV